MNRNQSLALKCSLGILIIGWLVVGGTESALAQQGTNPVTLSDSAAPADSSLQLEDVFEIEYASNPQISPDGSRIVFVRNFMDIQADRVRSCLWIINSDGTGLRPLTSGIRNDGAPQWSPDGSMLAFVSTESGSAQIHLMWLDDGHTAVISRLPSSPGGIQWSPDGTQLAFSMFVKERPQPMVSLPGRPEGADWAAPAIVISDMLYRSDGRGYLEQGHRHLFTLPVEGGTPRQLTSGPFNHGGSFCWDPSGESIIFSANRNEDSELRPQDSNLFEISLSDRQLTQLTDRDGPDHSPVISPDGTMIAYLGYDDRLLGFQVTALHIMRRDGTESVSVTESLDRSVQSPFWSDDGQSLFFSYSDQGDTKVAALNSQGEIEVLAEHVGGTSIGRPYSSGSFSVASNSTISFTLCSATHPADVAVKTLDSPIQRLTQLNEDLFQDRTLGAVEEAWVDSSFDGRAIQYWVVRPPQFDPSKSYPLLLEIHGGPFADYGPRFAMEMQLYAAAGYVVVYANPRGSSSYGAEFGNLIHHNYPSQDYDDLMSVVDAVIAQGSIDSERMFVTGGSGGGVLTAWIIGQTNRFAGAVVAKPVINWYSFALTADSYNFFYKYWFPGKPWEYPEHYLQRSPISYVGNVTTPTMLLTGEADYRTPISETEQYYQALKIQGVDSVMVRIPDASHGITARPSNLMAKVAYILKWFEMHDPGQVEDEVANANPGAARQ